MIAQETEGRLRGKVEDECLDKIRGYNRCSELLKFCVEIVGRSKRLKGGRSRRRGVYMWAEREFEKFERRFTS